MHKILGDLHADSEMLFLEGAAFKTQLQGPAVLRPLSPAAMGSLSCLAEATAIWLGRAGAGSSVSHGQTQCCLCRDNAGCVLASGPPASPASAFLRWLSLGVHSPPGCANLHPEVADRPPSLSCLCRALSHFKAVDTGLRSSRLAHSWSGGPQGSPSTNQLEF